jgi:DNA-binding SARP family transcriptional activator
MSVRLRLFGRPAVAHADATLSLPAERRGQLLAVLALRRGWVARTELAALLWPQQPPALALTNVRKALHAARAWPWTAALETQGSAVRFEVDTDVAAFERAWHEGRADEAVALHGGELLDGFDDAGNPAWSEWLDGLRAEHARRWQAAARSHLARLAAAPADAARFARTLLAHDPFDEDAVVALLAALHAAGDSTAMRATYRSYAERLAEELGVEPSLRVRAWLREAVSDHAAAAHDGFVGRARELQELAALLARPECRALTVTGPGGAGKSRLVKQALRTLAARFTDGALWIALDDLARCRRWCRVWPASCA